MGTLDSLIASLSRPKVRRIQLHAGQQQLRDEAKRFNVVACGRRWGKTEFGKDRAVEALEKGKPVGWFAPDYKYLDEAFLSIRQDFTDVGMVESSDATKRVIRLCNGGVLKAWTLDNPDAGRGDKYALAIVDEAAMVKGLIGVLNASILPTLIDLKGDLWLMSTPRGMANDFYRLYSKNEEGWASFKMPTLSNPYIPPEEVERARLTTPKSIFAQEYLADFVMPSGAVYDCFAREVNVCEPFKVPAHWHLYIAWDFGSANTAAVVLARDPENAKKLYVVATYFASGEEPSLHIRRVRELTGRPEVAAVGGASSEDSIREQFAKAGMPVRRPPVTGADSVEAGIMAVWKAFKEGNLVVFDTEAAFIDEVCAYAYVVDPISDKIADRIDKKSTYHRLDALRYGVVSIGEAQRPQGVLNRFASDRNSRV